MLLETFLNNTLNVWNITIRIMEQTIIKYARKCDITSEGMNEGYCILDGMMYIKYEKDMINILKMKPITMILKRHMRMTTIILLIGLIQLMKKMSGTQRMEV